jgi:hypothetical protein
MNERVPAVVRLRGEEQALDTATRWQTGTEETGGKNLCVVDDQKVTLSEEPGQVGDRGVFSRAAFFVEHEQARLTAFGRRILGNEPGRQVEIEVRNVH